MGTYVVMEISHVVREIWAEATELLVVVKESILEEWKISVGDSDFLVVVAAILAEMAISPSMMLCCSPC